MHALRQILGIVALLGATALQAGTITYEADVNGLNAPAGVTFSGGDDIPFVGVSYWGSTFLGFKSRDDDTGLEIRLNQSLTLTFATPQIFDYLTLGLLFDGDEYDDNQERAGAYVNGTSLPFILTAIGETAADWSFSGATVLNLSPASWSADGVWKVTNPFGNLAISSLRLSPLSARIPNKSESDFGLIAFRSRNVPDAASSGALFAMALTLLAVAASRRKP